MSNQYIFHLGDHEAIGFQKNFDLLSKLPHAIREQLISESEYWVQSRIQYQNLKVFLDYLFGNASLPEINENSAADLYFLCNEFDKKDLKNLFEKQEHDKILKKAILNNVLSNNIKDTSFCSEYIAQNLDYYLNILEKEMYGVPIPIIYNIFYNNKRNLKDQEKAYQFIKKRLINNDSDDNESQKSICILLSSLDASKISEESYKESVSKQEERFGFSPKCNISFITSFNQAIAQSQNQILNNFENHIQSVLNLQQQSFIEFKNYFDQKIDNLSDKIQQISDENAETKQGVNNILDNVNSLMSSMQQNNIKLISDVNGEVERKIQNLTIDLNEIKSSVQNIFKKVNNSQIPKKIENGFQQLSNQNTSLQSDIQTLSANINNIKSNVDQITPKINTIQSNVNTATTNINSIKSNVDQITPTINTIQNNVQVTTANINNIKSNVDQITPKINTIQSNIQATTTNVNNIKSNVDQITPTINTIQNNVQTTTTNINSIKSNVDQITPKITQISSQCEGLKTSIQKISTRTEIESISGKLTSSIQNLNKELTSSSENEITRFQKSINDTYESIFYGYHCMHFITRRKLDILYSSKKPKNIDIFKFYSEAFDDPFKNDDWKITGNSAIGYEKTLQDIYKEDNYKSWKSKNEKNSYIKIYFGEKKFDFQALRITNHSECRNYIDQLRFDGSNDGINWTNEYCWTDLVSSKALTSPYKKFTLWVTNKSSNTYYKYARIRMDKTNSSGNNILSLNRIELFGSLSI